jgi:hypothetical protein
MFGCLMAEFTRSAYEHIVDIKTLEMSHRLSTTAKNKNMRLISILYFERERAASSASHVWMSPT